MSPFFSLLSFLRKGVLFHHDLLVPLGSSWGSGACLPSSLFFSSGACLPSSLFFLSSGKGLGVLFHHDLLVLPGSGWGSGWGSGACLPSFLFFLSSGQGFCSIMICWLLLVRVGLRCCLPSSLFFGSGACLPSSLFFLSSGQGFCPIMICWFLLVPAWVPVLVSLLLSSLVPVLVSLLLSSSFLRKGFLFHHDLLAPPGSGRFRCLSPFFSRLSFLRKGVLFHHDLLVPSGSGWGSGACLPSSLFFLSSGKGFCSIMIWWFLLVPAAVPVLVSLLLSSLVQVLVSLLLSSFFLRKRFLFHHDLLVPPGSGRGSGACLFILFSLVSVLVSLLASSLPSSLFFGSGACLPSSLFFVSSGKGFWSIIICWFLLVPAGVPVLVSFILSSFFPQERGSVPS